MYRFKFHNYNVCNTSTPIWQLFSCKNINYQSNVLLLISGHQYAKAKQTDRRRKTPVGPTEFLLHHDGLHET